MSLLRTAGSLLSAAVLDLFPDAQILEINEDSIGFYGEFELSQEFRVEFLPLIEERMQRIQKRSPDLHLLEMIPASAKAFLEHAGQFKCAERISQEKNALLQIYQIEKGVGLCTGPLLKNLKKLEGFQLTEWQSLSSGSVRLLGIAAENRQALQEYAKKIKRYAKANHQIWGKEKRLFEVDKEWVFHPLGVRLRKKILETWSRECALEGFHEIAFSKNFQRPSSKMLSFCGKQEGDIAGREKRFLGLLAPYEYWTDSLYCPLDEQKLISSLQFARKFSRIFGFEPEWILGKKSHPHLRRALEKCAYPFQEENGTRLQWQFLDGLGRAWTSGFLSIEKRECVFSLFYALERLIALLLEKGEGMLPFWLDPEQVRIVVQSRNSQKRAMILRESLENEGFSCTVDEGRERLSLPEKVPYVIFLGKHEAETDRLVVQSADVGRKEEMSMDAFMQAIRTKIES